MKTILVAVVLAVTSVAGAQAAQPAQQPAQQPAAQPAAPASSQPVIKDPAEYNAYVSAVDSAKDANARISALEAFLTQYPNSVMKNQALEFLMQTYQQANNVKKTMETGQKLVTADPCNVRALTLLAYFDRVLAQSGDPNGTQLLADGKKYGQQGLDCLPKVTDADTLKLKDQMTGIFNGTLGIAALTDKDYPNAQKYLKIAVDGSPNEFGLVYPLALAYLQTTPQDLINGIWYGARAVAIAPAPAVAQQIEPYLKRQYRKYHGDEDGWTEFVALAKSTPTVPNPFPVKPAPTPAEQAHAMATSKDPKDMDFAMWEFILQNGSPDDRDKLWNVIKGQPVKMNGTVMKATAEEFDIAGSLDDIDAKKADITLTFEEKVPLKLVPKEGASLDFQGTPASYTPDPFMMTMEKGRLAAPPKPTPVHHAAPKKPAAQ
jgi:tetratricopeptide (TPR) repeat protein